MSYPDSVNAIRWFWGCDCFQEIYSVVLGSVPAKVTLPYISRKEHLILIVSLIFIKLGLLVIKGICPKQRCCHWQILAHQDLQCVWTLNVGIGVQEKYELCIFVVDKGLHCLIPGLGRIFFFYVFNRPISKFFRVMQKINLNVIYL